MSYRSRPTDDEHAAVAKCGRRMPLLDDDGRYVGMMFCSLEAGHLPDDLHCAEVAEQYADACALRWFTEAEAARA